MHPLRRSNGYFPIEFKEGVNRIVEQLTKAYGKGFAMLVAKGYAGTGLGKYEDGIANPIIPKQVKGRRGLTAHADKVSISEFGKFSQQF